MVVWLMLFICLTATFKGISGDSDTQELGKGVYLRKINLLNDFQEKQASVFESFPSTCFLKKDLHSTGSFFDYYESTKDFYSKVGMEAGLDASLQSSFTLGVTLSSVAQQVQSKESKASGMSLNVRALTKKILVDKDCLDATANLSHNLIKDLEKLPKKVEKPWRKNSWRGYDVFLKKYGSHVVTSVNRGASIRQTTFAKSSKSYSQRDFQVRSCVSFAGPTAAGKVGVEACANFSKGERSAASHMNTEDKLVIRGGKTETRSALRTKRTEELIEKFLREANESDAGVEHTFRSIWNILQSRFLFKPGSEANYIKAVNLQYYYLGFLNYGCSFKKGRGIHMQKFDYTKSSSEKSPEFECSLAAEGCHTDDDCHYKFIWCSCYGRSCVRYKKVEQETGVSKITVHANHDKDWGWHGCDWKVAGSYCDCYNDRRGTRKVVWTMLNRDAVPKNSSHGQFQNNLKDHDQTGEASDQGEESNEGQIEGGVGLNRKTADPVKSDIDQIREGDGPRRERTGEGREDDYLSGEGADQDTEDQGKREYHQDDLM